MPRRAGSAKACWQEDDCTLLQQTAEQGAQANPEWIAISCCKRFSFDAHDSPIKDCFFCIASRVYAPEQ